MSAHHAMNEASNSQAMWVHHCPGLALQSMLFGIRQYPIPDVSNFQNCLMFAKDDHHQTISIPPAPVFLSNSQTNILQ
jgi:hypothetical protein